MRLLGPDAKTKVEVIIYKVFIIRNKVQSRMCWHMSAIPAFRRWRPEDQELKVSLNYKPSLAIGKPASRERKEGRREGERKGGLEEGRKKAQAIELSLAAQSCNCSYSGF